MRLATVALLAMTAIWGSTFFLIKDIVTRIEVADLLADMRLDETSIAVGLLHDVLEDTLTTKETLLEMFGEQVAELVDASYRLTAPPRLVRELVARSGS